MNKAILSGTVLHTKEVHSVSGEGLHFSLQVNAIDSPSEKQSPTTDISCVIANPKADVKELLKKRPVIECEGKLFRFSIPSDGNSKAYRTQVVVNPRTIRKVPR